MEKRLQHAGAHHTEINTGEKLSLTAVLFATVLFIPLTAQGPYIDTVVLCEIAGSDDGQRVLSRMRFHDGSAFPASSESLATVAEDIRLLNDMMQENDRVVLTVIASVNWSGGHSP